MESTTMLSKGNFIRISFETNLFFQRIMKEHQFFLETNLKPVAQAYITEAQRLKKSFEELLYETAYYANNVISEDAIKSNEFVTPYTLRAEEVTSALTGASINTEITKLELNLVSDPNYSYDNWYDIARMINARALKLVMEAIALQKELNSKASECKIFISMYPAMLVHITHEAEYYLQVLKTLEEGKMPKKTLCDELNFWNHIMGEHAEFTDGMLDPSEKALKEAARATAKKFEKLVEECIKTAENKMISDSRQATESIRDYKSAATAGLLGCKIKSIIPPLLADHILREANHYLRLLRVD